MILEDCFRLITNKKFHKRLIFVVIMHGSFGMAWNFQYLSVNLLEPFIAPFTNQSLSLIMVEHSIFIHLVGFGPEWLLVISSAPS